MLNRAFRPFVFMAFILWGCLGCKPSSLKPAGYVQYIRNPENGFVERRDDSGLFIEAFYQPPEYVALMQQHIGNLNDSTLLAEINRNATFYQFVLSIGSATAIPVDETLAKVATNKEPFEAKKQRMLYRLQNSFSLLAAGDSLPCVFYHTQPSGKIDNAYHFILAFESDSLTRSNNDNSEENLTLIYHDSIWFQRRFDFVFDKNKINQSPRLKL